ncbi:putative uncharacterized protein C7orf78 homolog isoform X6 [Emydura macquarii macquarii]
MFVENGKYKTGMYQDPKPHDFRQYETNIPDFVTSYPRDPFNLKFKSQHLNAVHGLQPLKDKQKDTKRRFITYKPHECKWESGLILPKNPWPPKSASFTRHRRRRGAHTAFLDRVDEKLRTIWQEENDSEELLSVTRELLKRILLIYLHSKLTRGIESKNKGIFYILKHCQACQSK